MEYLHVEAADWHFDVYVSRDTRSGIFSARIFGRHPPTPPLRLPGLAHGTTPERSTSHTVYAGTRDEVLEKCRSAIGREIQIDPRKVALTKP